MLIHQITLLTLLSSFLFTPLSTQAQALAQQSGNTSAKQGTKGTFTAFSRKMEKDGKKKDTVVLWTSIDIQEHEEYDSLVVVSGDVNFYGKAKDLV